jgi:hypothetical protein
MQKQVKFLDSWLNEKKDECKQKNTAVSKILETAVFQAFIQ